MKSGFLFQHLLYNWECYMTIYLRAYGLLLIQFYYLCALVVMGIYTVRVWITRDSDDPDADDFATAHIFSG